MLVCAWRSVPLCGCSDQRAEEREPRASEESSGSFGGHSSAWLPAAPCSMAQAAGSFLLGVAGLVLPFMEKQYVSQ